MNNNKNYDVIISGAGPVGLFLACELALRQVSVLILEKLETPNSALKTIPFGIRGLSAPTIESLDRRGLLNDLEIHKRMKNPHQNSGQGPRRQGGHFAGIPFLDSNVETSQWKHRLSSSTESSLISSMEEIETILERRASSLGVEIKSGLAVTNFHETENGVTVQSQDYIFKAQWLIGCDGARSVVRKLGGFEFAGTEPEFTGYSTLVDIADPEKIKPGRNVTSRGMYMQSQPGYVIMQDFDGGAFHASEKPITLEHIQSILRRISNTDVTITAVHTATTWTDRARQVTKYRKERILLAGDSAHIHAPLGGQGLNLGIGDAMNLGWKLAATIHNKAPQGLLDSYQSERQPVGEQVLEWSRAQATVMKPTLQGQALYSIFRDLLNTRDGATYFAARVWGIFTHYKLEGDHPLVGHSVPNFKFENGKTVGDLMHDGRGLILDFSHSSSLKAIASQYGDQLTYICEKPKEQLGLEAVLVRPDGTIAWALSDDYDNALIEKALNTWFSVVSEPKK